MEALLPTMFSASVPTEVVDEFRLSLSQFHPAGFRIMARSIAEADLRGMLPRVEAPVLLLYGDQDVRAPRHVAEALHAALPHSELVVMPAVGHVSSLEAAGRFNAEVRRFLHRQPAP